MKIVYLLPLTFFLVLAGAEATEKKTPIVSPSPSAQPSPQNMMKKREDILARYSQISKKVNNDPYIGQLKEKADEAQKSYQDAFEAAVAKEDPTILDKYRSLVPLTFKGALAPSKFLPNRTATEYAQLTDGEKRELEQARKAAIDSPVVKDLRQRRNSATSETERAEAEKTYSAALRDAMIQSDQNIERILAKLDDVAPQVVPNNSPTVSPAPTETPKK